MLPTALDHRALLHMHDDGGVATVSALFLPLPTNCSVPGHCSIEDFTRTVRSSSWLHAYGRSARDFRVGTKISPGYSASPIGFALMRCTPDPEKNDFRTLPPFFLFSIRFDDAFDNLQRAAVLDPTNGDVLYRAGVCAINQGAWSR